MEVNKTLTDVERGFNIAGGIPVVAVLSGALRAVAGKFQVIAGAIIGILGLIGQMVSNNAAKWEHIAQKGLETVMHGGLNLLRGFGETLVGLTVVGSLGILAGQALSKNKFEPIYKYDELVAP